MDSQAAQLLTGPASVRAEQAVFTSRRTPMQEGYCLAACSEGLSAEEKKELTRRSPSHDSLCDPSPDGWGLASYELSTGRRCVAVSRPAGREHTGRGGFRVCTRIAVLDPADFRRFACDPFQVQRAILAALEDRFCQPEPSRLKPLELVFDAAMSNGRPPVPSNDDAERILRIAGLALSGTNAVVEAVPAPVSMAAWIVQAMPPAQRFDVSISAGIKYSPARGLQLVLMEAGGEAGPRSVPHNGLLRFNWQRPVKVANSPFDCWLSYVREGWTAGRHAELAVRVLRLGDDLPPTELARVVKLFRDLDAVRRAETPEELGALEAKHGTEAAGVPPMGAILFELREEICRRRALVDPPDCPNSLNLVPEPQFEMR